MREPEESKPSAGDADDEAEGDGSGCWRSAPVAEELEPEAEAAVGEPGGTNPANRLFRVLTSFRFALVSPLDDPVVAALSWRLPLVVSSPGSGGVETSEWLLLAACSASARMSLLVWPPTALSVSTSVLAGTDARLGR